MKQASGFNYPITLGEWDGFGQNAQVQVEFSDTTASPEPPANGNFSVVSEYYVHDANGKPVKFAVAYNGDPNVLKEVERVYQPITLTFTTTFVSNDPKLKAVCSQLGGL